jgi:predicted nucleic acid-binding protein
MSRVGLRSSVPRKAAILWGLPPFRGRLGNALLAGFRRRRLTRATVNAGWISYQRVELRLAGIDVGRALEIAMDLGLYAYDAYVLETARAERVPLATLDRGLARAAVKVGLRLVEFES